MFMRLSLRRTTALQGALRSGTAAVAVWPLLLLPRAAKADATTCAVTHQSAQQASQKGQLRKALDLYTSCGSDESCPDVIRKDCMALFAETNLALPTVTFAVTNGSREIPNVKVYSGGDLITKKLDGRAVGLDPGWHRFRFVLPQGRVLTSEILLREGEKNRLIQIRAAEPRPGPASPELVDRVDSTPASRALPASFWIASGVGLSAVATGTTFALLGLSQEENIANCAPTCPPQARPYLERARGNYLVANLSFGVAAVSTITAAAIYFSTPAKHSVKPPPVVSALDLEQIAVVPSRHGLNATLGFRFGSF